MKMYEHRTEALLPRRAFWRRVARHGVWAAGLVVVSIAVGIWGFWYFAGQPLMDALLNTAMLLGGMGPVGKIRGNAGKLFAAAFALYAGLVFLVAVGLAFAPFVHRMLHKFHLEEHHRPDLR